MRFGRVSRRVFLGISTVSTLSAVLDWEKISAYAAKIRPKSDYPTLIVGSGLGGLCCAAYLAKDGFPVTVLEKRHSPGGYATAFRRGRGRFNFEVSLHGMPVRNNAVGRIFEILGLKDILELVELPEVYQLKTPKLEICVPARDPERYISALAGHFPDEKEGIRRFVEDVLNIAEESDRLHRKGTYSILTFPFKYPKMFNIRNKTVAEMMDGYVKNPSLRTILTANWDFHGLPPSKVSALYYASATGDCLRNGTCYIKNRSEDLSNALVKIIKRNGGEIIFGSKVEEILVRRNAVRGVKVADGTVLPAKAVVSNASVPETFYRMVPKEVVPRDYLTQLKGFKPGLSSFVVWLGLKGELRGRFPFCGIQMVSEEGAEQNYQYSLNGVVERVPFRVSIFDNMYEEYSEPGTSSIKIFCLTGYEPWRRFEIDYRAGRKESYYLEKDRWTDILVKRTEEQLLPGLSEMIEIRDAATPLTNWRFTGNVEGAVYGFEQSLHHAYIERIDNKGPVEGLYLTGAWCAPGGGFSGVMISGQLAFARMMEDWGVRRDGQIA
jgi:prolycopene isomerase